MTKRRRKTPAPAPTLTVPDDLTRWFEGVVWEKVGDVIRITATEPPTTTDHGCIVTGHMEGAVLVVDQIEDLPPEKS